MRKGYDASWMLDKKGEIFAIATGSDATAEHEWGSTALMREMTGWEPLYVKDVVKDILAGRRVGIPDVLSGRVIAPDLPDLVFDVGTAPDGVPVAAIGFTARAIELKNLTRHRELQLSSYELGKGAECSGAWDDSSFAFSVRGERNVEKLKRFHKSLIQGNGMFAGLFLPSFVQDSEDKPLRSFSGVVICDVSKLRPEHRAMMKAAQEKFAEAVRKEVAKTKPELAFE